jgi:hypothetical protein
MAPSLIELLVGDQVPPGSVPASISLYVTTCAECGTVFAVGAHFLNARRKDGQTFFCPNGHSLGYGPSEADKLRKQLKQVELAKQAAEVGARQAAADREALRRSNRALKGVVTRIKNAAARGVCPCCGEYFPDLHSHMQQQHPDYEKQVEPEEASS